MAPYQEEVGFRRFDKNRVPLASAEDVSQSKIVTEFGNLGQLYGFC